MPSVRRPRLTALSPLLAIALLLLMASANPVQAHIGGTLYPIYELTDRDLAQVDLRDGSIAEWAELLPGPSIVAARFFADPTVGDGAQYDPTDLDFRVWFAWHGAAGRLYLAIERVDDVYINDYSGTGPGAVPGGMWAQDSVELLVDGDHGGGDFSASADPNWTPDEQKLNAYRTAQAYLAVATAPGSHTVGYLGAGGAWVDWPPFTDAGGGHSGGSPDTSVIEFHVTPFDDLRWDNREQSVPSRLYADKIIGFAINVPDWDVPGTYHAFYQLVGNTATWRYADRFVDGRLVPAEPTAVPSTAWARIKASLR